MENLNLFWVMLRNVSKFLLMLQSCVLKWIWYNIHTSVSLASIESVMLKLLTKLTKRTFKQTKEVSVQKRVTCNQCHSQQSMYTFCFLYQYTSTKRYWWKIKLLNSGASTIATFLWEIQCKIKYKSVGFLYIILLKS